MRNWSQSKINELIYINLLPEMKTNFPSNWKNEKNTSGKMLVEGKKHWVNGNKNSQNKKPKEAEKEREKRNQAYKNQFPSAGTKMESRNRIGLWAFIG